MSARRRTGRTVGRVVGATVAVVAVAAGAAAGLGFDPDPRGDGDPGDRGPRGLPPATAPVTRETLVDTETETGKLTYGDQASVSARTEGTLTGLPVAGESVDRGKPLYQVDAVPVVMLYGPLPAYRPLSTDTRGADVRQFEENLWALGYRGFTVDDTYTYATATAVKKWQKDLGLAEAARTGTVEPGRVVYTPGPVRVDTLKAAVGDAARTGNAVLTYTGLARVVEVDLEVAAQRLAVVGTPVTVRLPDGRSAPGKVARTRTVVDPGDGGAGGEGGSDPTTKIRVTVTLDDDKVLTGLDQASAGVVFTAARHEGVLTVPVAALLALSEGGYGVQVVTPTGTRTVAVRTGMFANGRVEVSGDGLAEGTTVGMPT